MNCFFWRGIGFLVLAWPLLLRAEEEPAATSARTIRLALPAGVRLGAWLTQNRPDLSGVMYLPGLMWNSKSEALQQEKEKNAILLELTARAQQYPQRATWLGDLKTMLSAMPVTGRKALFLQDPWLMQTNSALEPIAGTEDELVVTGRPQHVRVITPETHMCDVKVLPQRWASDYLQACGVDKKVDNVWLIQPDGQVSNLNVSEWNAQKQEAPAPGAWLWVPPTNYSPKLSRRIAKFIATQGVAQGPSPVVNLPLLPSDEPQNLPVLANDWGMSGLLQTPSARTPQAGHISVTANRVWPYTHTTLSLSPFDSLELGVRYTNITNQLYGPSIAGNQGYKDKSSEIKWRMLDETASRPAVAIGLRDPGGTGLFAGEYVVASKRWKSLDMSLGLGWGYLGSRGNLSNPLRIFGQRFATRQGGDTGSGGTAQLSPLFTGRTALFGGVQWQTPVPDVVLKVELDGNNYKQEPLSNDVGGARSPVNLGLAWQNGPLSLTLGYERGQQWMVGFSLSTDLSQLSRPKYSEPVAWPVTRPAPTPLSLPSPTPTPTPTVVQVATSGAPSFPQNKESFLMDAKAAEAIAQQTGWQVHGLREEADAWIVELNNAQGFSLPERIDRGMRVVHELAPSHIRSAQFVLMQQGVPISSRQIERATWADARYAWQGQAALHASAPVPAELPQTPKAKTNAPSGSLGFGYQQHLGGPDGYLYALNATAQGQWPLWQGAWAQGTLNARVFDNYGNYHYTAPSNLPRVRTYVREYLTSERLTLPLAQVNQLNQWGDGLYSLVYAGALESMFAGVGAEFLWRPLGERWAIGADMNRLAQRDFDQRFSLRDYRVNSGHVTAYWDTGWKGTEAKLLIGQYLAGDRGATLEVSRRFDNGTRMGAWVTKTNVSSATFGEGSFDKGVFISIPFDAFLNAWSTTTASLVWQPLIRDGGARLNKSQTLWNLTNSRDERAWLTKTNPDQQ